MCRSIRRLYNYEPPSEPADIEAAALQYVRKVSGFSKPSIANQAAFERAVDDIASVTSQLLESLVTSAPPRDRQREIAEARERNARRYGG